jgi:two-component system sensor histidine kinase KdpD
LLAQARREEKGSLGRLKIFVGAAPGVGKTYEMLQAARAKMKEGVDVLVGVVETHGRKETEALLEGLPVLPRKPTIYVNRILSEFDIDAALRRRPQLILVDELAHTNVPAAGIRSATRMSRSCWMPASTSTRPSTSSTSRA